MKLKSYTTAPILAMLVFILTLCAKRIIAVLDMGATEYLLCCGAIQLATYFLPLALYLLLFGRLNVKRMRLATPTPASIPLLLLLLLILLLGSALLSMLGIRLGFSDAASGEAIALGASDLLALLVFALIPAFCEEIVFRGVIMPAFEPCGTGVAVVATSLLFAFAHMSIDNFLVYFFSSLILCYVAYVSRSVFASVLVHTVYNIAVLSLSGYISGVAVNLESFSLLFIGMLFLVWVLIVIALGEASRVYRIYAKKGLDSSYTPQKISGSKKLLAFSSVFFSVPFLLSVLIYIATVVLSMQEIV